MHASMLNTLAIRARYRDSSTGAWTSTTRNPCWRGEITRRDGSVASPSLSVVATAADDVVSAPDGAAGAGAGSVEVGLPPLPSPPALVPAVASVLAPAEAPAPSVAGVSLGRTFHVSSGFSTESNSETTCVHNAPRSSCR